MRNDQIFVLLLVVLLPLSGCFSNTVGDAEAETGDVSDISVLHHIYFENTTTLNISEGEILEIVDSSSFRVFLSNGSYGPWGDMSEERSLLITGDCYPNSYVYGSQNYVETYSQIHYRDNIMLHTTGNDCTYELGQDSYVSDGAEIGWVNSVVYRIHSITE